MKRIAIFLSLIIVVASCSPTPEPIQYGADECQLCKMLIMDSRYGSELVTSKGKVYKFDSIECLVNYCNTDEDVLSQSALLLITPYNKPNTLVDATQSSFLKSSKLPSPMGEYLNGFETLEEAEKQQVLNEGTIYSWTELLSLFESK